jgi:hypothetical protein
MAIKGEFDITGFRWLMDKWPAPRAPSERAGAATKQRDHSSQPGTAGASVARPQTRVKFRFCRVLGILCRRRAAPGR